MKLKNKFPQLNIPIISSIFNAVFNLLVKMIEKEPKLATLSYDLLLYANVENLLNKFIWTFMGVCYIYVIDIFLERF